MSLQWVKSVSLAFGALAGPSSRPAKDGREPHAVAARPPTTAG